LFVHGSPLASGAFGSYSSALVSELPPSSRPPTTRIFPLVSGVAVCLARATFIGNAVTQVPFAPSPG
jgi:hypothetical protein